MAKKLLLTSLKGGTGVTTVAVGLGLALASAGERTLIVDGDTVTGCAEIAGECRDNVVYTLADYEKGACRAKQTLVAHPKCGNLLFMPSVNLTDSSIFSRAVGDVDGLFDYILCDKAAQDLCDGALIVTEPFTPSIKSADVCRSRLTDGGLNEIGLIVNRLSAAGILNGET
ncbi:MAG: AAA family ATPase, partial [Clostridia bacterium]|nr:AAA family ATPase [Clostridia bacterium]